MKRINLLFVCFMMAAMSASLMAQMPSVKVKGEKETGTVVLKKIDINVEIIGNTATTTMEMVFHNNNTNRILEGELTFPMPEGVTVSRYALDINGRLREAVPVPKRKATEVFESIEHRRIDPGLLERVEGNNFRTRIYPFPANGDRTILIAYEETLTLKNGDAMQYHLPFDYKGVIAEFSLQTKIYNAAEKPQLVEQPDGSFAFSGDGRTYEAYMHKTNFNPNKPLTVSLPKGTDIPEIALQKNIDESNYFLINVYKKDKPAEKIWSDRIGIIWDNSLSGLSRDKDKELALLDRIIRKKQNVTIELGMLNITFKKAGSFRIKNGDWSDLKTYLQNVIYDGGTDFSKLNYRALPANEYLLFTEGMSTFGNNTASINKPVYIINSSSKADYSALKAISANSGGKFVNLTNTSVEDAFKILNYNDLQFMGIQEKSSVSEVYPSVPTEVNGHISIAGIARNGVKELTLLFGRDGEVESKQKIQLNSTVSDIKVNRIWAQKKIAEMDIRYEQNNEDIELLGRQFGIVTRNTSLIVLEDIADYVRYEITPPEELLSAYNELIKNRRVEKEYRMNDMLDRAVFMVDDLKEWWKTDFRAARLFPKPKKESEIFMVQEDAVILESQEMIAYEEEATPVRSENKVDNSYSVMSSEDDASQAQFAGYSGAGRAGNSASRQGTVTSQVAKIKLPEIKSDKEYITQISSANDAYTTYLSLREAYMGTPGFYFDVSNFFYKNNQKEKGLLILSNLAELDIENADLFKTLAYRLKEKGEYAYGLFVTGKILAWRPMDAQSHRDYALALQDNGQYQEALDHLYSILNASYSPETALRDHGIEEILVCEINNLISLHRNKLNLSKIDKRIIADLPVNVRVVINWNKNDTDIDLWVTDPNGEKCFYGDNRTSIGGRLSDDFTQGFGPEQFLLKKAINGTYKIETNFFGENQLTLSGPTTIMGEIYLYYSDGREERQIITFQNGENGRETDGVLIGEFVFSDKKHSEKNETAHSNTPASDNNETGEAGFIATNISSRTIDVANSSNASFGTQNFMYLWIIGLCCLSGMVIIRMKRKH